MSPDSKKLGSARDQPRHRSIYEELLADLNNGAYAPGDRLPSEAQLCQRFGVSRITVARAVQTLQRDGLVVRRPGSGSYVQPPPSRPDTASMQFGLLIPDLGVTEIFDPICRGMMRSPIAKTHSLNWGYSVGNDEDRVAATEALCRRYIEQRVAGVFFAPIEYTSTNETANRRILHMLQKAGMPVVLLDRCVERYPDRSSCDLVGIDNHRAGNVLTRHLIEVGARRIVFAVRAWSASSVDQRLEGYREALNAAGLGASTAGRGTVAIGDFDDPAYVRDLLSRERPDGIVCANDRTAARLMQTLLGLGVRIPQDVRLVGVDDVRYGRYLPVSLTTIRQNCDELGAVAMSTMLERIERPTHPVRDVLVRCDLIVRQSSGAPTTPEDPEPDPV